MHKRLFILFILSSLLIPDSNADEGMWLPWHLPQSQINKMQEMGLQLTANDIYSSDQISLKDAIVSIDKGSCTGSFISKKGLLLTNHHCAMGEIQQHSTVKNDYLKNGFWASSTKSDLPNPGKTVTLLIESHDLTSIFEQSIRKASDRKGINHIIDSLSSCILDTLSINPDYDAEIKDFYHQNKFFLFITETFRDIRLVGAPPEDIGQFGGEKDNWTWPRHSADFALFRVYTSPDGKPADYHADNIPYEPKKVLNISAAGIKEGDFTMIPGYPGQTQRYLTSHGIKETRDILNPIVAEVRSIRQKIWKQNMRNSHKIGIQYADKYASSGNYYKYTIGQNKSIRDLGLISKKEETENKFNKWIEQNPAEKEKYSKILTSAKLLYLMRQNLAKTTILTIESLIDGPEINSFVLEAFRLHNLLLNDTPAPELLYNTVTDLKSNAEKFFRDFSPETDKQVFEAMVNYYIHNLDDSLRMEKSVILGNNHSIKGLSEKIYLTSLFADPEKFNKFIQKPTESQLSKDPAFAFLKRILNEFGPVYTIFNKFDEELEYTMHQYLDAKMAFHPERHFYPDANSTLRLTYGKISGYSPRDGVVYAAFSSHKGLLEKTNSGKDQYQTKYDINQLFKNYLARDAEVSKPYPICFITDNDITGGSSGSPVLNHKGDIVGLAFDGNWEGMASDLAYSESFQRCINVDIRYILHIVEKKGPSQIYTEMTNQDSGT